MKKLFLSVMIMLLGGGCLFAQNTIDVSGLKVEAGTVTFKVEWSDAGALNLWSDTVWVFVDYNKNGKMTRMLLEPGSTLTATSSPGVGKLVEENVKGAWVVGDARTNGSFSATVQLLTATADLYGACAYASSYPPVGQYVSASEIIFSGTPMYEIWLTSADGVEMIESGGTFLLPCDYTMSSFTDATGAPGIINCMPPTAYALSGSDVCDGTAVTLTLSGSQSGWQYRLYDGTTPVGSAVPGTDGALIFTDASAAVGGHSYTVRTVDGAGVRCDMSVSNALGITVQSFPVGLSLHVATLATICKGESATLTAAATGAASYSIGNNVWQTTPDFNVTPDASITYTLYVQTTAGCTASIANAAAVAVNPVPDPPIMDSGGTQCSPGTITAAAAGLGGTGIRWDNNSTTSARTVTETGTYYAVTTSDAGCESSTATVTVTINPMPSITHSGGSASQTVCQDLDETLTTIVYTASDAAVISMTGSFPTGVTGTPSGMGTSYTISGRPTKLGTFGYSLTASVNGCTSSAATGTITVTVILPPAAASTNTWIVGTQMWSDVINIQACDKSTYAASNTTADCRNNGSYGYLYSWQYVYSNLSTLCPSPWSVPTNTDFCILDKYLNNSSTCTNYRAGVMGAVYNSVWGGTYGGVMISGNSPTDVGTGAYYWSMTFLAQNRASALIYWDDGIEPNGDPFRYVGQMVRCVRNYE